MKLFVVIVYLALCVVVSAEEILNSSLSDYDYNSTGFPRNIENWEDNNDKLVDRLESKIIGGWFVDISEVPFQAGLLITVNSSATQICGACLYSHTHLLTAGHCIYTEKGYVSSIIVVLGATFLLSEGIRASAIEYAVHPDYNPPNLFISDIGVIRVPPVQFTPVIQPIRLPMGSEINTDYTDWMAMHSGYGLTKPIGNGTRAEERLSAVTFPIISNPVCAQFFPIYRTHICAAHFNASGACSGDSGGPLVVLGNDKRPILVGLASFVRTGCLPGWPTVFTRVTAYLPWIASI
ncbi:collagenase-like [Anticarsia gemmatalis]|uniref:collagenase-like n=1 Tax=Anticarsia gemmatalis TaxID=129554 RepID=UPI003F7684FC